MQVTKENKRKKEDLRVLIVEKRVKTLHSFETFWPSVSTFATMQCDNRINDLLTLNIISGANSTPLMQMNEILFRILLSICLDLALTLRVTTASRPRQNNTILSRDQFSDFLKNSRFARR